MRGWRHATQVRYLIWIIVFVHAQLIKCSDLMFQWCVVWSKSTLEENITVATRIKRGKIDIWKAYKGVRFELNRSRVDRVLRTNGLLF